MIGLFAGLATLDTVYLAAVPPGPNQKTSALDFALSAGGPACNAAVTHAFLGGEARLACALGRHPVAELIRSDLRTRGVDWIDLTPDRAAPPPVSSVIVTAGTGERAVISRNAEGLRVDPRDLRESLLNDMSTGAEVLLVDGHQMALARHLAEARATTARDRITVVDAGSWKPGFEAVLAQADYVLCSADFHPPGCTDADATLDYLEALGVPHGAVTRGPLPIMYRDRGRGGLLPAPTPRPRVVDTLGAGDLFHGAFCYYCPGTDFVTALRQAARVASAACASFGTRTWMRAGRQAFPSRL